MATATGQKLAAGVLAAGATTVYTVTSGKKGFVRIQVGNLDTVARTVDISVGGQQYIQDYSIAPNGPMITVWEGWCNGGEAISMTPSVASQVVYWVDGPLED
jgi:hypothetical protein